MTQGLLAASTAVGLDVVVELMELEVAELAGPKGRHNPARAAKRHGNDQGTVTLGGRRLPIRRPRVRSTGDQERELPLDLEHLPEVKRPLIQRRLRATWAIGDADQAQAELEALARGLTHKRPGAAASLREGLEQTLTVNRLGVGGSLLQTVESTNPVESMIEIVRDHATRVKRWSSGEMTLCWAAAGMLAAEGQFRRVKGYRELPQLARALEQATTDQPGPLDLAVGA
jgi:Transposase, Mutator family